MDDFGVGARMRAARHLAGFRNVEDLAKEMNARGLGTTKLRQIEREETQGETRDLREIAETCRLPLEWFTADFSRLGEISDDPRKVLAQRSAEAVERARARRDSNREDRPPLEGEGRRR